MYVPELVVGYILGLFSAFILFIVAAVVYSSKRKDNKEM